MALYGAAFEGMGLSFAAIFAYTMRGDERSRGAARGAAGGLAAVLA